MDETWRRRVERARPWGLFVLIVAGAGALFLTNLGAPRGLVFDESHYMPASRQMENGVWEDPCWEGQAVGDRPVNWEHPPLAKMLAALSMTLFEPDRALFPGCRDPDNAGKPQWDEFIKSVNEERAWSWRLPGALLGTLGVAGVYIAAQRLGRSHMAGVLASGFVLADGIWLTSSRIYLLDIYAAGFAALALAAATFPTKKGIATSAFLLGLAIASKYTAVFVSPAIIAVAVWMNRREGMLDRRRFDFGLLAFLLIPFAVLMASYSYWWVAWTKQESLSWAISHWWDIQKDAFHWDTVGATGGHPYQSQPWEWLTMAGPTYYYLGNDGQGHNAYIWAIGNAMMWWLALASFGVALVGAVVGSLRARTYAWSWWLGQSDTTKTLVLVGALPLASYLPFLLLSRTSFVFYITVLVPFFALALALALARAWNLGGAWRIAVYAAPSLVAAWVAVYVPLLLGIPITGDHHQFIRHVIPWMRI